MARATGFRASRVATGPLASSIADHVRNAAWPDIAQIAGGEPTITILIPIVLAALLICLFAICMALVRGMGRRADGESSAVRSRPGLRRDHGPGDRDGGVPQATGGSLAAAVAGAAVGIALGAFRGAMIGSKLPFVLADWGGLVSGQAWFDNGRTILSGRELVPRARYAGSGGLPGQTLILVGPGIVMVFVIAASRLVAAGLDALEVASQDVQPVAAGDVLAEGEGQAE